MTVTDGACWPTPLAFLYSVAMETGIGVCDYPGGDPRVGGDIADQERPPAQHPNPAALVALAWVHLERDELRETHRRLKQADGALGVNPDKLISTVACLAAAGAALADGRAAAAVQIIAGARSG